MFFRPNPYFENEVLSKEYALDTNGESMIKGTEIKWKPGKNITEKSVAESKGRKRGHEDIGSFFLWFCDLDPSSDEPAELIKDDIWPNPLQFYLGGDQSVEVEEGDYDGEEDDGLEAEEEEEEEEEEVSFSCMAQHSPHYFTIACHFRKPRAYIQWNLR
ncbi:Protein SET [Geodia barretti]|uniref:Protein SET n=1 Tax=Geodia barretti TaxID=519541 RepID=A0AA35S3J4_GEOBA|nr:Protein SET [Geodia barretti]